MKKTNSNHISTNFSKSGNATRQIFLFGFILFLWLPASSQLFTKITNTPINNAIEALSASWCDFDSDGDLDVFVNIAYSSPGNVPAYSQFFQNNCNGEFTRILAIPGNIAIDKGSWASDCSWIDYDNDGFTDLYASHGNRPNSLFKNNGDGTFTQITNINIVQDISKTTGNGWADYNNDGFLDLFVPNAFGAPESFLYKNNGNGNHWLDVKCIGTISNTSAIGARIYAKANINGTDVWQMREINANGKGIQPLNQHFGFGNATIIDTLKIYWPASHTTQIFTNVQPDRFIVIKEDVNTITEAKKCKADFLGNDVGTIKGYVFSDANNNCIFEPTIDNLFVNDIIKATVGDYYVSTKNDGSYNLRLPSGNFDVSQISSPNIQICPNIDTSYNLHF